MLPATDDVDAARKWQEDRRDAWTPVRRRTSEGSLTNAEPYFRKAERLAVSALNHLEDHPRAEEAHALVHEAMFYRRGLYGCPVLFKDGHFWSRCPSRLIHNRVGVSAGLTGTFACSVCGQPIEDCDHIPDSVVPHVATRRRDGFCSICDLTECEHIEGAQYDRSVRALGTSLSAHEVSFVRRPRYPDARFTAVTLDLPDEYRRFAQAEVLNCDDCLGPCGGMRESGLWLENPNLGWSHGFSSELS